MSRQGSWSTRDGMSQGPELTNLRVMARDMKSRMRRESHVRFRGSPRGKFPRATRRVSRRSKVASCCALDEGRPLEAALQEEASNRHERLLPNGDGRERHGQKARLDRVRYG